MDELRLGDVIDDHCIKCRRLTNHSVVSMMDGEVAKVRCRSCYHEHTYLREQAPPSKKDLKKAELFNEVLSKVGPAAEPESAELPPDPEASPDAEPVEAPARSTSRARAKKT